MDGMKPRVLALDYDGTIAEHGRLDGEVRRAIAAARDRGLAVVLVTGRTIDDLRALVGRLDVFDLVVAENGALLVHPSAGRSTPIAPRVEPRFVAALRAGGIGHRVGTCVVELAADDAVRALQVIRDLRLPLTIHFNRDRAMVLPQAVSKATGLREALRTRRLSTHNAVAVGDAENDHELLRCCEIGAAVRWGSPALVAAADVIVEGEGPRDVAAFLREVAGARRLEPPVPGRRRLVLGRDAAGARVALSLRGRNFLIAGDPRSGKSWIAGLICEQLITQQYCTCVLDPEGDYGELAQLPGVVLFGHREPLPSMHALGIALGNADVSCVLDLSQLALDEKRRYAAAVLQLVHDLRRTTGLPHDVVVDEAHYFLHELEDARRLDPTQHGYVLISWRISELHPDVLRSAEVVLVTRESDPREAELLHRTFRGAGSEQEWTATLAQLRIDEAVLLPVEGEAMRSLVRLTIAPRVTAHVRHRHKYLDVPVQADQAFRFDGGPAPARDARCLGQFVAIVEAGPLARLAGHLERGDFSRWIRDVVRDETLAAAVREVEDGWRCGSVADPGEELVRAVRERYDLDAATDLPAC